MGGNRWFGPQYYWLWDGDKNLFVFNQQLSDLSGYHFRNLNFNQENRQVVAWMSGVDGRWHTFYEFMDGVLVPVSTFGWTHLWMQTDFVPSPEGYTVRLVRRDLITGEEEIWYENWE